MRALLGIAGLAAFVGYCFHKAQVPQRAKAEAKEDLRRWEGEGGNDPAVATPEPVVNPQSSYPMPESDARH